MFFGEGFDSLNAFGTCIGITRNPIYYMLTAVSIVATIESVQDVVFSWEGP